MARAAVWAVLAVGAAAGLGGCGTIHNLQEQKEAFGGVKLDNDFGVAHRREGPNQDDNEAVNTVLWLAAVADLPLSAVGDTLTLPAIWYWQSQKPRPAPAAP